MRAAPLLKPLILALTLAPAVAAQDAAQVAPATDESPAAAQVAPATDESPAAAQVATTLTLEQAEAPVALLYDTLGTISDIEGIDHRGRSELLEPTVMASYDLPFMAAKVLGRHWRKLEDSDRLRWIETFSRLTVDTYAERFAGAGGEQFAVLGVEPSSRETALVRTQITPEDEEPVAIDYRLHQRGGSWRIVDVYLNGTVSELALRRSEYSSVMKRDGLDSLIGELDEKIAAHAAAP